MTLGHSHASMAATLAYRALRGVPAVGVYGRRGENLAVKCMDPLRRFARSRMTFGNAAAAIRGILPPFI